MKRGLVFSLCAFALAAYSGQAKAQTVSVSLNLHYTNPANPASGGTFQLVAKVAGPGTTQGISALNAYISNINQAGLAYGSAAIKAMTDTTVGSPVFDTAVTGGVNILYGQDTSSTGTAGIALGVGTGGSSPGNQAVDPLLNTAWDNSAVLITGTFGGTRPAFITAGANSTAANLYQASAVATGPEPVNAVAAGPLTVGSPVVRGDASRGAGTEGAGKGLWEGDANRDGVVNSSDLSILLSNFNGNAKTWDQGNFDNTAANVNATVNSADLSFLLTNFNKTGVPVSISSVPEPAGAALAVGALAALIARRRRN